MDNFATFVQFIDQWAWIGWLILIAVFLVIEMLTLDFTFLMLSFGSALGLVTDLVGIPVWAQVIIAAAAAAIFILFLRPPLLKRLRRGEDPTKSNVDALIDLRGIALHDITQISGQVKLSNGDTWTARTATAVPIPQGSPIAITAINGATAIVRPVND
ncbi:NfeD family protein [Microbacterium saperdae]|jgi:membrane protein implicated in regulation of membrane protease activity|uniref:Membrane protein implicated in regulation of membrane protease activity n=1 Tax=Microbacterium saperdae TaxID=69368 RepID=A0A543BMT1_9MICO|nr:NfeD family protein [Microbacterium saperdae]TQL86150.1 membrane protein implicated in regulation of membrane protease activity [Microbacterium saperdae]GGM50253.1 membrane protein [Microbacterium saperdae]